MTPGVSTTTFSTTATFASVTGSWDANYPVTNLADLLNVSKVGRATPSGGNLAFTAVLSADQAVQVAAVVAHTLPAGATIRVRFYSDAGMTSLVTGGDLGPTAIPTPVSGDAQTFVALMAASQTVRAVRVDIASAGSSAIDIGGLEIGGWFAWGYVDQGAEHSWQPPGGETELLAGGSTGDEGPLLRTFAGSVSHLILGASTNAALDWESRRATGTPFVFCLDTSDATRWPRWSFLARNVDLSPLVAAMYDSDSIQFRFIEHRQ